MNKILFSIYTGEYPNQFAGGPNNIIYKTIKVFNKPGYKFDFLSSDLFVKNVTADSLDKLDENLSKKKKTAFFLANNSQLYRKFFGSDFYLPYHFYKKNKYFKLFGNKKNEYNIIHCQDSVTLSLISNNSSAKKVMTIHSKGPLSDELRNTFQNIKLKQRIDKKLKKIELKNIDLADLITFPSIAAKNYFEESLNISIPEEKIKIIYNGIEFDKIQNITGNDILERYLINSKGVFTLLNIAAHGKEKNIDILLRTVKFLKDKYKKNVLLINVGVGNDTKELQELTKKLNISDSVKFLGKLPNEDVIKLLKATDMFIMTSEKVIFDLVVLEALACGACCVVSDEGGNKEIIKDGENGYLIDINDIEGIAKKIISIDRNRVKEKAIETAKQFSVQKMVDGYFEIYESLLNGV